MDSARCSARMPRTARNRRGRRWHPLVLLSAVFFGSQWGCATPTAPSAEKPRRENGHIDIAMRGSYPKLASTNQILDRRLDLPLKIDVLHVFDEPYTPFDRRADLGLATFYLGLGRQPSDHFVWTWYLGGGMDQDINHQRFLNTRLKVDFRYGYYYTGVTGEYYPWGVPESVAANALRDLFSKSRPFFLFGFETGYVSGEGEGDYLVSGAQIYHDEEKVRDWLAAVDLGLGWAFPLSEHLSFNLQGGYRFHFTRPDEYNGWAWVTAIRYRF